MPGGTVFGPGATGFFCGAVAHGSRSLVQLVANPRRVQPRARGHRPRRPRPALRGRPGARRRRSASRAGAPGGRRSRRPGGCTSRGGRSSSASASCSCRSACSSRSSRRSCCTRRACSASRRGTAAAAWSAFVALALGTTLTLLGLGLVQAATARALVEIDAGRDVGPLRAYRLSLVRARPLFGGAARRRGRRLAARELALPAADRRLARRPLGARRPRGRAGGRRRARRAPPQPPPRPGALAQGRVPRRRRRRARARRSARSSARCSSSRRARRSGS